MKILTFREKRRFTKNFVYEANIFVSLRTDFMERGNLIYSPCANLLIIKVVLMLQLDLSFVLFTCQVSANMQRALL